MERIGKRLKVVAAAAAGVGLLVAFGAADAGLSKKIQNELRGQIVITETALNMERFSTDKDTRLYIKQSRKKTLKHRVVEGVPTWDFNYTVFMKKKPKTTTISFDFYTDDKEKLYIANKKLVGIDPSLTILQGTISITEDDGPVPGRKYIVKLSAEIKGKEIILATTKLQLK